MTQTAQYRHNWLQRNINSTMGEILSEFPHLLDPGMVKIDKYLMLNIERIHRDGRNIPN